MVKDHPCYSNYQMSQYFFVNNAKIEINTGVHVMCNGLSISALHNKISLTINLLTCKWRASREFGQTLTTQVNA